MRGGMRGRSRAGARLGDPRSRSTSRPEVPALSSKGPSLKKEKGNGGYTEPNRGSGN